jgi:hypothetical protein
MAMLTSLLVPTLLLIGLVALPLVWRIRADRRRVRAEIVRGDIVNAINHRLGGESLLTVDVIPETLGRSGRIVLWTPAGYESLVETVWRDVSKRAPAGYDLIVRRGQVEQSESMPRAA